MTFPDWPRNSDIIMSDSTNNKVNGHIMSLQQLISAPLVEVSMAMTVVGVSTLLWLPLRGRWGLRRCRYRTRYRP